jgi:hypothetical protein
MQALLHDRSEVHVGVLVLLHGKVWGDKSKQLEDALVRRVVNQALVHGDILPRKLLQAQPGQPNIVATTESPRGQRQLAENGPVLIRARVHAHLAVNLQRQHHRGENDAQE